MASYSATVIVDPPELGGGTHLIVEGRTFVLRGGIVRGLRDLAKCEDVIEREKTRKLYDEHMAKHRHAPRAAG